MASPKQVVAVDPHSMFFISFCLPLSFYVFFFTILFKGTHTEKKKKGKNKKRERKNLEGLNTQYLQILIFSTKFTH
jgi:hypothetical protein